MRRTAPLCATGLILLALSGSVQSSILDFYSLWGVDDSAVCNDGTAAGFYFSEGRDPSTWLIFLMAGGWCYDQDTCLARGPLATNGE